MPTYAPNFTGRAKFEYQCAGLVHTVQLRKARGSSDATIRDLAGVVYTLFNPWNGLLGSDFVWLSAAWARQDEDFFTPMDLPTAIEGSRDPTQFTPIQKITATTFSGRAPFSKARFSIYGIFWEFTNQVSDDNTFAYDGKVLGSEMTEVNDTVAATSGQLAAGSGQGAIFYPRATVKPNDRLLRLVRRGLIA